MPLEGFSDYKRREFCHANRCSVQLLLDRQTSGSEQYEEIRGICKSSCIHSTYEFHHWLIEEGYQIVKPE